MRTRSITVTLVVSQKTGHSFEVALARRGPWIQPFAGGKPLSWKTARTRDEARACFTRRKSFERGMNDLIERGFLRSNVLA